MQENRRDLFLLQRQESELTIAHYLGPYYFSELDHAKHRD